MARREDGAGPSYVDAGCGSIVGCGYILRGRVQLTMLDPESLEDGRITALRAQSRYPGRVSVFIDDEFAFGINQDLVLEFGLAKGLELTAGTQRAILERESHLKAKATALRFLAYRDRSEYEVRRRLERSHFSDAAIAQTIEHLHERRLLDDASFALAYAEGRFQTGGYGPNRIRQDLRRKGVPGSVVERAVEHVFRDDEEHLTRARELGRRRWEKLDGETDSRRRKKKTHDYLLRRGYTWEVICEIIEDLD